MPIGGGTIKSGVIYTNPGYPGRRRAAGPAARHIPGAAGDMPIGGGTIKSVVIYITAGYPGIRKRHHGRFADESGAPANERLAVGVAHDFFIADVATNQAADTPHFYTGGRSGCGLHGVLR